MPIIQTSVAKSGAGGNAYATAPDVDLTDKFTPDYYEIRADQANAAEVVLSWDGVTDGLQIPVVANNGGFYTRVETHGRKVWVRRASAPNAAAVALVTACTNV